MFKRFFETITFNRSQRNAIAILVLIFFVASSLTIYRKLTQTEHQITKLSQEEILAAELLLIRDSISKSEKKLNYENKRKNYSNHSNKTIKSFNPNQISSDDWQNLGFSAKQAEALVKFKDRIGGFKNLDDFKKAFVVNDYMFNKLKNYMVFDDAIGTPSESPEIFEQPSSNKERNSFSKDYNSFVVNVNTADASQFKKLYGIGDKLSKRIVSFREKLGGFYSVNQVAQVYGLPDSTFQNIKSNLEYSEFNLRKISLNSSTEAELKSHPYISWNQAKQIVNFRQDWHPFNSLNELVKEKILTEQEFEKVKLYLKL